MPKPIDKYTLNKYLTTLSLQYKRTVNVNTKLWQIENVSTLELNNDYKRTITNHNNLRIISSR